MHPDPLSKVLGFELLEEGPGFARARAVVKPEHCNFHGTVHGGFVFSLADAVFAGASNSHGPQALALTASIHFSGPAAAGDVLEAEATEVSLTARTAVYQVTVACGQEVVATFVGTVYRRPGD